MLDKRWVVDPECIFTAKDAAGGPAEGLTLTERIEACLLKKRGVAPEATNAFFVCPGLPELPPEPALDAAVDIILAAADNGLSITVYGDYDCDGMCSAAVLYDFLTRFVEARADYYIPDRFSDGYGITPEAVERLCEQGTGLIITVDNGVSAAAAAQRAEELGIAMVITDHHLPPEQLPVCGALIDPHIADSAFPYRDECGAGVAFTLVRALAAALGIEDSELGFYLGAVALATVGDSVPLTGLNRIYAQLGLMRLRSLMRQPAEAVCAPFECGLRAILAVSGLDTGSNLSSDSLHFRIVPRFNASGRMGSGRRTVELLLTEAPAEAQRLAAALDADNTARQQIEKEIFDEAVNAAHLITGENDKLCVCVGETWHEGVIGIVATRVMEKYNKPALLLTLSEDGEDPIYKGSGRSVDGVDLHKALTVCSAHLLKFGGHKKAGGLSIRRSEIANFIAAFNAGYDAFADSPEPRAPEELVHLIVPAEAMNSGFVDMLEAFEPFGEANPQPKVVVTGLTVANVRRIGQDGAHLKFLFAYQTPGGLRYLDGVLFREGSRFDTFSHMRAVSVLCTLQHDSYRPGNVSLQLTDIHEYDLGVEKTAVCMYNKPYVTFESFSLDKAFLRVIYRAVSGLPDEFAFGDLIAMRSKLIAGGRYCSWYQLKCSIDIFIRLGILSRPSKLKFRLNRNTGRVDPETSELYRALQTEPAD